MSKIGCVNYTHFPKSGRIYQACIWQNIARALLAKSTEPTVACARSLQAKGGEGKRKEKISKITFLGCCFNFFITDQKVPKPHLLEAFLIKAH